VGGEEDVVIGSTTIAVEEGGAVVGDVEAVEGKT